MLSEIGKIPPYYGALLLMHDFSTEAISCADQPFLMVPDLAGVWSENVVCFSAPG